MDLTITTTQDRVCILTHRLRRHVYGLEQTVKLDLGCLCASKAARLSGAVAELRKAIDDIENNGPDEPPARNNAVLDLIWKHTHPDYKGRINGVRYVLTLSPDGATISTPLQSLPKAALQSAYRYAMSRAARGLPPYRD